MAADSTPEEEVRRLERHYSVNPEGLVFARLADAYRRCGRLERSLELLREGVKRHPDYTTGHLIQGRTLREAGRTEEAAACFRRVLELDAGNLVALRSLAELAAERGEMDRAHRWTERLEQADPFTSFDPEEAAARAREPRNEEDDGEDQAPPGPVEDVASTELPGESGLASEIAAMADEQWWSSTEEPAEADAAPPGDSEDSDVATETMAHLYAQQGLHERAADVYRRLLDRRPDDRELQRRLEEMTRRASGREPEEGGEEVREEEAREDPAPPRDVPRPDETASDAAEARAGRAREREISAAEHFRALLRGEAEPIDPDGGERPGDSTAETVSPNGPPGASGEATG